MAIIVAARSWGQKTIPPAHTAADLKSPIWWLDRAEDETTKVDDPDFRRQIIAQIQRARSGADDLSGLQRMSKKYPPPADAASPEAINSRIQTSPFEIRRLVAAGKIADAKSLADDIAKTGRDYGGRRVPQEVAVDQARAGDIEGALATLEQIEKPFQPAAIRKTIWLLLIDDKPDVAEQIAQRTPGGLFGRLAVYRAAHGDADGAVADFNRIPAGERSNIARWIGSALGAGRLDSQADRVIDLLSADDRNAALAKLAGAELDRGDLDAALATSAKLDSNSRWQFHLDLLTAQVRVGRIKDAVNQAEAGPYSAPDFGAVFTALLKYKRLDDANELLLHLPQFNDPQADAVRGSFAESLAAAFADGDQMIKAEDLFKTVSQPAQMNSPAGVQYAQTSWAIAAAKRRAGDPAAYDAVRLPLVQAVNAAQDAQTRVGRQTELLIFDLKTGNISGAQATASSFNPDSLQGFVQILAEAPRLSGADESGMDSDKPVDLEWAHNRVLVAASFPDSKLVGLFMSPAARTHIAQGTEEVWLNFAAALPGNPARALTYLSTADELIPKDPPEPEY